MHVRSLPWSLSFLVGWRWHGRDPEGLRTFYYLVQDLKCFVFSLIALHFKIKPLG